jgi:hypothetical protein
MLSVRISSWRERPVHASVPDALVQCTHQFLTRTFSACISSWRARSVYASVPYAYAQHVLKVPFQIWIFYAYAEHTRKKLMRMLRIRISSWRVCSANPPVPDAYAQGMHQFPTGMLSMFWRDCAQCTHKFLTRMLSARFSSFWACWGYTKWRFEKWENWCACWACV